MTQQYQIRQSPSAVGKPRVDFRPDEMDVLVDQKGLKVVHESAIVCPCKSKGGDSPLSTCRNCGGTGIVFINPIQEKMVIQSVSRNYNKLVDWSAEAKGTVSITTRNNTRLGDLDRITVVGSKSQYSQLIHLSLYEDTLYGFTVYPPIEIIDVFLFNNSDTKLVLLSDDDYRMTENALILDNKYRSIYDRNKGLTISIRYLYEIQYLVIDQSHELRDSYIMDGRKDKKFNLPVTATARRLHHVMASYNLDGRLLFDNSYIDYNNDSCKI